MIEKYVAAVLSVFAVLTGLSTSALAQFDAGIDPVVAEMFVEHQQAEPGSQVNVAIRITPEEGWHTYWVNPGDAGRPTEARFSGIEGAEITGPAWPVPEALREDVLVTYGYGHAHTLLYSLTLPETFAGTQRLEANVSWLVCKDICIPGAATVGETISAGPRSGRINADIFDAARAALPREARAEQGTYEVIDGQLRLGLPEGADDVFPARQYLVNHAADVQWSADRKTLAWPVAFDGVESPDALNALVVRDGEAQWLNLQAGSVTLDGMLASGPSTDTPAKPTMAVWQALMLAFFGGIILNLMPCVFPVLALKAMGLSRGDNIAEKRREAWVYTAGVLVSFVGLAAVLLVLRATGAALGWGFQLQNPAVVAGLAVLLGFLGLALAGWTQIGMGLMGLGQNLTQGHSPKAAFFTGVLAVVVASPCTAPFMGAALGFAITQPAIIALVIFASLGLGLAAPILLIAIVPALAKRLPRPGPWMDKAKLLMAIPLLGTAGWLYSVVFGQAGLPALVVSVVALLVLAIVTRQSPSGRWVDSAALRWGGTAVAAALILAPAFLPPAAARVAGDWQPWSAERVAALQAEGRPIFVDFTADWCISCLVNERTALADDGVQALFSSKGVALLKADWTRQDPAITAGLAEFDRNGVPLYLVYDRDGSVVVLPQLLTPGIVREALNKL